MYGMLIGGQLITNRRKFPGYKIIEYEEYEYDPATQYVEEGPIEDLPNKILVHTIVNTIEPEPADEPDLQ